MQIHSYIKNKLRAVTADQRLTLSIVIFALLCTYPWRDGHFLLLDYVSIPGDMYTDRIVRHTGLVPLIIFLIGDLFGSIALQYILFTGALILLGIGTKRILQAMGIGSWGLWFGVLFAICNPFIYTRMIEGQSNVFFGFGLIYMAMSFMIGGLWSNDVSKKRMIGYVICAGLGVSYLQHSIFFVALLTTGVLLMRTPIWQRIARYIYMMIGVILINSNWILAGIIGTGRNADTMKFFGVDHVRAFAATSPDAQIPFHLLSLHGFWGESMGRFANMFSINHNREYIFLLIFMLVVVGIYKLLSNTSDIHIPQQTNIRAVGGRLIGVGGIAYLLSMGTAGRGWMSDIASWMYEYIPFYVGLREPQKRTGVLLFCYVIGASVGIHVIMRLIRVYSNGDKFWEYLVGAVVMLLPLLYAPTMLFALGGQLTVYTYPKQRYDTKQFLHSRTYDAGCVEQECYDVLVFPWHQYVRLSWGRSVIANPIERFLKHDNESELSIVAGDNMEMKEIYTQSARPVSAVIEKYVGPGGLWSDSEQNVSVYQQFVQDMMDRGIEDIVLLKEATRQSYIPHLDALVDFGLLEMGYQNDMIEVYSIVKQ